MEFRQARRKGKRAVSSASYLGSFLLVILVCASVIYLIGASSAGTWVAKNLIAPVFGGKGEATVAATDAPEDSHVSTSVVTETITFGDVDCYMLQIGVYSTEENAKKQSSYLQSIGAGGYILEDGGLYRVIAAGYLEESSLQTVRSQLVADGIDSVAYTHSSGNCSLLVTAPQSQIEALENVMKNLGKIQTSLADCALAYDKEQMSPSEGRQELQQIITDAQVALYDFTSIVTEQNALTGAIQDCYGNIITRMQALADDTEADFTGFTAQLKYTQLYAADRYKQLIHGISTLSF